MAKLKDAILSGEYQSFPRLSDQEIKTFRSWGVDSNVRDMFDEIAHEEPEVDTSYEEALFSDLDNG